MSKNSVLIIFNFFVSKFSTSIFFEESAKKGNKQLNKIKKEITTNDQLNIEINKIIQQLPWINE